MAAWVVLVAGRTARTCLIGSLMLFSVLLRLAQAVPWIHVCELASGDGRDPASAELRTSPVAWLETSAVAFPSSNTCYFLNRCEKQAKPRTSTNWRFTSNCTGLNVSLRGPCICARYKPQALQTQETGQQRARNAGDVWPTSQLGQRKKMMMLCCQS